MSRISLTSTSRSTAAPYNDLPNVARRSTGIISSACLICAMGALAWSFQTSPLAPATPAISPEAPHGDSSQPQVFTLPQLTPPNPSAPGNPQVPNALPNGALPNNALPGSALPGTTGVPRLAPPPNLKGNPKLAQLWDAAILAQRQNKLGDAAAAYRELLRLQPEAVPAHVNLALILLQQKQNTQAVWHLRRATIIAPGEIQPRVILAQTHLYMKKPRDAFKQWTQVAAMTQSQSNLKPVYIQAVMSAGTLAAEQLKDLPAAETWLRRANEVLEGRDPRTSLMLSGVLSTRGKHAEAAQVLLKTSKQYPKVIEIQSALAQAQWAAKDQDGAIRTLRALEGQIPASQNKGLALSQVRVMLGRALAQKKEYSAAVGSLRSALATLPKNSPALTPTQSLLAQTYAAQATDLEKEEKLREATLAWSRAAELFPKNPVAYLQRGRLFQKLEQSDAALSEYRRALQLLPNEPNALLQAARLEEKSGNADQAGKHWRALITSHPAYKPAYYGFMGWAARQQQLSQQLPFMAARAAKTPEERAIYEAVAASFIQAGKGKDARDWLESITKKYPNAKAPEVVLRSVIKAPPATPIPTPTPSRPAPTPGRTPTPQATPKPKSTLPKSSVAPPVKVMPTPIKPNRVIPKATPTSPAASAAPEESIAPNTQPTSTIVKPEPTVEVQ